MTMVSDEQLYKYASFAEFHNRLTVRGRLVAQTALRVGKGRATDVLGNDLPVLRDYRNRPFIPGASLKGAFRARLEGLIHALAPDHALSLEQIEQRTRDTIAPLKEQALGDEALSEAIWQQSTLIDLTFGSPELAGRLFFKDALVETDMWYEQFEVRNGVVLNRDTETAEDGLLYDYEVVPAGTPFQFELVLEQAAEWQVGMVLMALRPWERGDAQIGGFRSRGLGYVSLEDVTYQFVEVNNADDVLRLLCKDDDEMLQRLGIGTTSTTALTDDQREEWYKAFRDVLRHISQEQAQQTEGETNQC